MGDIDRPKAVTKTAITRMWIWGLAAMIPAGVLVPSSALALARRHHGFGDAYSWTMVGLIGVAAVLALVGAVAVIVAWIEAMHNARLLPRTHWLNALRRVGLVGILTVPFFGLGAFVFGCLMMAYLVGAPDGLDPLPHSATPHKAAIVKWSGRGWILVGAGMSIALLTANLTGEDLPLHGVLWPTLFIESIGFSVAAVGALIAMAAWWAAILNAHALADQTWFKRLRWTGIAAALTMPLFGLGGLIVAIDEFAYARWAPDGMAA